MIQDVRWAAAICAVALLGAAVPSHAADRSVFFSIEGSAEATDNRDSTPTDEQSNVDLMLTPRAELRLDSEGSLVELSYAPTVRWRSDAADTQNDTELFHDVRLDVVRELSSRLDLDIREYFNYTDDPSITQGATTLREDGSYILNRLSAILGIGLTARTYVDLSAYHRIRRYDEDAVAAVQDEDETRFGASYWMQLNQRVALLGEVSGSTVEFDDPSFDRGFDRLYGGVGIYRKLGNEASVDLRVGAGVVTPNDDTIDEETQPAVSVRYRTDRQHTTRLGLDGGIETRGSELSPFSVQDYVYVSANVEHDLSNRLTLQGAARWSDGEYETEDLPSGAPAGFRGGTETLMLVQGGMRFKVTDGNVLTVRHTFHTMDSDVVVSLDRDYDRNVTFVSWRTSL